MSGLPWHRPELRAHRIALGLGLVLLVSIGAWVLGLPFVGALPAWFYLPVGPRALEPSAWVWLGGICAPLAWLALRLARRHIALSIAVLVALSIGAQVTVLAMDEGTAISRLEQGHGEFFRIAHERRGRYLETMREYEALAEGGALGVFAPSKPPGTLSFYMALDALSEWGPIAALVAPQRAELAARPALRGHVATAALGVVAMPFFTALALIPIVLLARRLGGSSEEAAAAGVLYATQPGILLISYHADGALFPLVAVSVVLLAVVGGRQARLAPRLSWLGAAGAALALGVWCNFSMLPLIGMLGILLAGLRAEAGAGPKDAIGGAAIDAAILVAVLTLAILWGVGLFAHPLDRFAAALEHHRRWKSGAIGGVFGAVGALEFWLWAGPPLAMVFVLAVLGAVRRAARWTLLPGDALAIAALAVHLVMAIATGCVEAARLWLWVTPFFVIVAARFLRRCGPIGSPEQLWVQLALCQVALTLVMRFCQPW